MENEIDKKNETYAGPNTTVPKRTNIRDTHRHLSVLTEYDTRKAKKSYTLEYGKSSTMFEFNTPQPPIEYAKTGSTFGVVVMRIE